MEKAKQSDTSSENWLTPIGRWFGYLDDIMLLLVAIGIIALAGILLAEAFSDFYYFSTHSIPHIISELLIVLILMELLRQVLRQLQRHTFSLYPFFFIGVIAGIRGVLVIMMKLALGEADGWQTLVQIGVYAFVVLIMTTSYYICSKTEHKSSS